MNTLSTENKRLRALNRRIKEELRNTKMITSIEASVAIKQDCTLDDVWDATEPTPRTTKGKAIAKYLKNRDFGRLFLYGNELYVHWINRVDVEGVRRIERVFWCEQGEESIFRQSIEGHVDFLPPSTDPAQKFSNWAAFRSLHSYGLIAFCGHSGDAGRSAIPQDISWYGDVEYSDKNTRPRQW